MKQWDVAIVGAGPAGAACAITCARAGLQVLLLDRAKFPRDKVCGDCLNPACWPILERLQVAQEVRTLPHARFRKISILTIREKEFTFDLPADPFGEIGIRRRDLDDLLVRTARQAGAEVRDVCTVKGVSPCWKIVTDRETIFARYLVAADGRNSSVARLLNLLPPARKDRVGLQTHFPLPEGFEDSVRMQLLPEGYSGGASIGDGLWNLCLVARPPDIDKLKQRASEQWNLPSTQVWRSITPLSRSPIHSAGDHLLFAGDTARIVEPFTGEGIYYALASGELAGRCLVAGGTVEVNYAGQHPGLYRKRLWLNQLSRQAVLHPALASWLLENLPVRLLLRHLTAKITQPLNSEALLKS